MCAFTNTMGVSIVTPRGSICFIVDGETNVLLWASNPINIDGIINTHTHWNINIYIHITSTSTTPEPTKCVFYYYPRVSNDIDLTGLRVTFSLYFCGHSIRIDARVSLIGTKRVCSMMINIIARCKVHCCRACKVLSTPGRGGRGGGF